MAFCLWNVDISWIFILPLSGHIIAFQGMVQIDAPIGLHQLQRILLSFFDDFEPIFKTKGH